MSQLEGIRACRSLEQDPWLKGFQESALQQLGGDTLDFDDKPLGTQEVDLLSARKFIDLRTMLPEVIDGEELAEIAEENKPDSFHTSLPLRPTGNLGVIFLTDQEEACRRVLVAEIHQTKMIVNEQKILDEVVNKALGVSKTWRPTLRAKLATVNEEHAIRDEDLQQLAHLLPEEMRVQPGEIAPINDTPKVADGVRSSLEEIEPFGVGDIQTIAEAEALRQASQPTDA